MKRLWQALLLSAILLPASAGAMVPEGTAHIAHSLSDIEEERTDSFSSFAEGYGGVSESVLCFNDGYGRLTEFRMTCENDYMTLLISQNGREVYHTRARVRSRRFSAVRREEMGRIYFQITLGEHTYVASVDREDHWYMEEMPQREMDEPVPLSGLAYAARRGE